MGIRALSISLLVVLLMSGCSLFGGTQVEGTLDLTVESVPQSAESVVAVLTQGEKQISEDLTISEGSAKRVFENLNGGLWHVQIKATNSASDQVAGGWAPVTVKGGTTERLTIEAADSPYGLITYLAHVGDGRRIMIANEDGSNPFVVAEVSHAQYPVLSSDGTQIVFESEMAGTSDIYVINVNGSGLSNVTNSTTKDRSARWSPDDTKIVYESGGNIAVMNPDGTDKTVLATEGFNIHPSWSPDGSQILFSSNRIDNKTQAMHIMNADGSDQEVLLSRSSAVYEPLFSPDGTKIAFLYGSAIWLVDPDGSNVKPLTNSEEHGASQRPAWSPDSTKIAFHSSATDPRKIHIINVDGTGFAQLTNGDSYGHSVPSWSLAW